MSERFRDGGQGLAEASPSHSWGGEFVLWAARPKRVSLSTVLIALSVILSCSVRGQNAKPELKSYLGTTPVLDGVIHEREWSDATRFAGVRDWVPEFSPVERDADLALRGYVKHDVEWVYFAFDVTDDILYGIDTPRWLPNENVNAHELTREGFPWFGDEMELLINATGRWVGDEDAEGNGSSWQMVCNLTKSRLGGVGVGGLLEGEPRREHAAWETYGKWIRERSQVAVIKEKLGGKGYIVEWAVRFNPCFELSPGRVYSPAMGELAAGLNIALGDLDEQEKGKGNFGNFHHEQWFAGVPHLRTQKRHWGILRLMGTVANPSRRSNP